HRSYSAAVWLGAERHGALEGGRRVLHAKAHGAHGGAVRLRELLPERIRFRVDDEVDVALGMQRDVLAAVTGDDREAEAFEQAAQRLRIGRGVLDELETVRPHGVGIGSHHWPPEGN